MRRLRGGAECSKRIRVESLRSSQCTGPVAAAHMPIGDMPATAEMHERKKERFESVSKRRRPCAPRTLLHRRAAGTRPTASRRPAARFDRLPRGNGVCSPRRSWPRRRGLFLHGPFPFAPVRMHGFMQGRRQSGPAHAAHASRPPHRPPQRHPVIDAFIDVRPTDRPRVRQRAHRDRHHHSMQGEKQ